MPTKHDHLKDEITDILTTVSGLTVVSAMVPGQEPVRPYARLRFVGWKKDPLAEARTTIITATAMINVFIEQAGGIEGLEAERNRLDNLIEKAFDLHQIADYTDADFNCNGYIHEYEASTGVIDDKGNRAAFTAVVQVKYIQTPLI